MRVARGGLAPRDGSAPGLVAEFNADRGDEVARLAAAAAGVSSDAVTAAELLWVDAPGAYARLAALGEAEPRTVRVRFEPPRAAADERDARSHLTIGGGGQGQRERE